MKSASKILVGVAKRADELARALDALALVPVGEVARSWRTTKEYVRRNVPIVKLGPKQHRVRLQDAIEFQNKRIIR